MAVIIKGKGTFGVQTATQDLAQSLNDATSTNETLAINASGEIVGVALSQKTREMTVEVLVDADSAEPEIGGSYAGLTGVVTAFTKTSSNTDFARYSVTVKSWGAIDGSNA